MNGEIANIWLFDHFAVMFRPIIKLYCIKHLYSVSSDITPQFLNIFEVFLNYNKQFVKGGQHGGAVGRNVMFIWSNFGLLPSAIANTIFIL